jgi:uncharacterized protein (DUF362 family)
VAATGAAACAGPLGAALPRLAADNGDRSRVFRIDACPIHDNQRRHRGVDTLFDLLAENGLALYRTATPHPWASPDGIIEAGDIVVIKVNCVWSCRGGTNTDVVRGVIHRLLEHPDGFAGEVVIIEGGPNNTARFDGHPFEEGTYAYPVWMWGQTWVNAEEQNVLSIEHLVNVVFASEPVSAYLLDPIKTNFIGADEHTADGYRMIQRVSYPCLTTAAGHRIELREGRWTGTEHAQNVKLINIPVLKHHDEIHPDDTGLTGALKNCFGTLSMDDGYFALRHYDENGLHCGMMQALVRAPDLHILDGIWISPESIMGYPPEATRRLNTLMAGRDPVAIDYYAGKHVLKPINGLYSHRHDPDSFPGLISHLTQARDFINGNGGIFGEPARMGDDLTEVIRRSVVPNEMSGLGAR